jgi:hypothetical protein
MRHVVFSALIAVATFAPAFAAAALAGDAYGSQRLVRLSNGRPGLMVTINGQGPFPFLIDTGTSHTVLVPGLRAKLGIPATPGPRYQVVTAAGRIESSFHTISEVTASGVTVEGVNAIVIDLPKSIGVMGIVGADFLSNFTVDLDLGREKVTLYPAGTIVDPAGFVQLKGTLNSAGFIVLPSRVENVAASAVFDSGAVWSIVNPKLAAFTQSTVKAIARNTESRVVDAANRRAFAETADFKKVALGPVSWRERQCMVAAMHVFEQIGLDQSPAIFIGLDMMAGRRVILDYANASLYLLP